MKAWLSERAGGPDTLRLGSVEKPRPGKGQLLVAVKACGINFPDALIIEDRYQMKPQRPFSPGAEVAGVVEAVGEGVGGFAPGMPVCGSLTFGGLAQYAVLGAAKSAPLPEGMGFAEGAAFLIAYLTALHALTDRGQIRAGETILVLGAAGGTGVAAIQIARALGAKVIAAASSSEKAAFCRAQGADDVVVYPAELAGAEASKRLADAFKAACGPGGADIVFDPVGGAFGEPAMRAIAWHGRYLVIGFTAGIGRMPMNLPLLKASQIVGVYAGGEFDRCPAIHGELGGRLVELFRTGAIRPPVSEIFPFADAPAAIARLANRQALGKVVVAVDEG